MEFQLRRDGLTAVLYNFENINKVENRGTQLSLLQLKQDSVLEKESSKSCIEIWWSKGDLKIFLMCSLKLIL